MVKIGIEFIPPELVEPSILVAYFCSFLTENIHVILVSLDEGSSFDWYFGLFFVFDYMIC